MAYYLFFLFFLIVTSFSLIFYNKKLNIISALFLTFIIIILGTIRWKTGYDWVFYLGFYTYVRDYINSWGDLKVSFEPLYTSLNFIGKWSGFGFVTVQFLQISIIAITKFFIFKNYTPYIVLAIFLNFAMFSDIVTIRNFIAATMVFASLPFVERKNIKMFFLFIMLGIGFHYSAIIGFLFYPLYHLRISIGVKTLLIFTSIAFGFTGLFGQALELLSTITGGHIGSKLEHYNETAEEGDSGSGSIAIVILGILRRLVIIPIIFYFEEKLFKKDKLFKGVSNLFIFGNILYFLVGNEFRIFQRLSIPFYLCEILLLVWIYSKVKIKSIFFAFLVLYGLSKYYYVYTNNRLIDPYITIFNPDTPQKRWDQHRPEKPFENEKK